MLNPPASSPSLPPIHPACTHTRYPRRNCVVEIINRKKTLSKRRPSRAKQRMRGRCCFLYCDYAQKLLLFLLLLWSDAVAVVPSHRHHQLVGLFLNILNRSLYSTLQLKQKPNKQTNQYNNNKTIPLVFSHVARLDFVNIGSGIVGVGYVSKIRHNILLKHFKLVTVSVKRSLLSISVHFDRLIEQPFCQNKQLNIHDFKVN